MRARIVAVDYQLGKTCITNSQLATLSEQWTEEKIWQKTGVRQRSIATADEYASDLACHAAEHLFDRGLIRREEIDFLVYVTQSPDQLMPATACVIQSRLGLASHCGAIEINQGCSGYVYGLGVVTGLVESGQARHVLLLCADTVSRYLAPDDLTVRTLFGDAGSATSIQATTQDSQAIGPFLHGTDGSGAENLCVRGGGLRQQPDSTGSLRVYHVCHSQSRAGVTRTGSVDTDGHRLNCIPSSKRLHPRTSSFQIESPERAICDRNGALRKYDF